MTRTPDIASFGIPATIGGLRLVATVRTMDPDNAYVIAAAGGDPSTAVDVHVQVSGPGGFAFEALRIPGVTLDALTRAAEPFLAGLGMSERSVVNVAGWTVVRYASRAEASEQPKVLFYARRGDWIYGTDYMIDAQLATFIKVLAGLR